MASPLSPYICYACERVSRLRCLHNARARDHLHTWDLWPARESMRGRDRERGHSNIIMLYNCLISLHFYWYRRGLRKRRYADVAVLVAAVVRCVLNPCKYHILSRNASARSRPISPREAYLSRNHTSSHGYGIFSRINKYSWIVFLFVLFRAVRRRAAHCICAIQSVL